MTVLKSTTSFLQMCYLSIYLFAGCTWWLLVLYLHAHFEDLFYSFNPLLISNSATNTNEVDRMECQSLSAKKRFQMLIAKRASTSEIRNPTASCRKFVRITFASILSVTGRRRWGEREEIVQQMLGWQKVELTVVGMMAFVPWSRVSSQSPAISHSDLTHSPDLLTA